MATKSATLNLAAASEETPLLQANPEELIFNGELNGPPSSETVAPEEDDRPLPKAQLFLLCYCRMVEPIAFFSIFPYINKMIEETGIEEQDVGFYSGLIVRYHLHEAVTRSISLIWSLHISRPRERL